MSQYDASVGWMLLGKPDKIGYVEGEQNAIVRGRLSQLHLIAGIQRHPFAWGSSYIVTAFS